MVSSKGKTTQDKPVNLGGRPRERDRDEVAALMLEWAKKPDSTNLNGFCITIDPPIPPSKIGQYAREDEKFRLSYETVKSIIGQRREEKLSKGQLHVKAYDLNAAVYDYFLKEERRAEMAFEQGLKSQVADQASDEQVKLLNDWNEFIHQRQSARKIAPTKRNKDK